MSALTRQVGLGLTVMATGFGIAGCGNSVKDKIDEAKTTYTDAKTTVDDARKAADCVQDAGSDADKLEACTK